MFETARRLLKKHPDEDYYVNIIAVGFCGNRVISYGFNSPKTHPRMKEVADKYNIKTMYEHSKRDYVSRCLHAELDAINNATKPLDKLVVLRENSMGELACARPCRICQHIIKEEGIKDVYYSDEGKIKHEIFNFQEKK